jgi:hypothetical protein
MGQEFPAPLTFFSKLFNIEGMRKAFVCHVRTETNGGL